MYLADHFVRIALVMSQNPQQCTNKITAQNHPVIKEFRIQYFQQCPTQRTFADIVFAHGQPDFQVLRQAFGSALIVWIATSEAARAMPPSDLYDEVWPADDVECFEEHRFYALLQRHIRKKRDHYYDLALHAAINSLPNLIWFKAEDKQRTHLKVNDAFAELVGKEKSNIQGFNHWHIWDISEEEYRKSEYVCVDTDDVIVEARKSMVFDETVKSAKGMRQFKAYKSPIIDEEGTIIGTVGVAQDVTDFNSLDMRLITVLNSLPYAVIFENDQGQAIHLNTEFEKVFDVKKDDLKGKNVKIEDYVKILEQKTLREGAQYEMSVALPNGKTAILMHECVPILDIFNVHVATLHNFVDVTMSREFDKKLKDMAYTDRLTGLFTRHYLFNQVEALKGDKPVGLLSIDLDNFKKVNDNYGHAAGDDLLKIVADQMRKYFPDEICVRLGGDEFLVMKIDKMRRQSDQDSFVERARNLGKGLVEYCQDNEQFKAVNISGGITFAQNLHADDFDELLSHSDTALYHAKRMGKGRVEVFDPSMSL